VKELSLKRPKHKEVADNFSEEAKRVITEVADVAGFLWNKGWAERNAGNISVRLSDPPLTEREEENQPFFISLQQSFPDVAGKYFFVTGTNRRMRDLARQPLRNALIIRVTDNGSGFNIISHHGKTDMRPTSELSSHLAIHSMILRRKSEHRVVMHTHATELIALTQIKELCNQERLNRIFWGMHPETKVFVPEGVGFVPYYLPGTAHIAEATVKVLEKHDVALWEKHGVFAIGKSPNETFDTIDILSKSASVYFMCRSAGAEPEGLTMSQIKELGNLKF